MDATCDCPHIDRNDPRCASRLTLGHLDQAFDLCVGAFNRCPIFTRLRNELAVGDTPTRFTPPRLRLIDDGPLPLVTVTCGGRDVALRPTGT